MIKNSIYEGADLMENYLLFVFMSFMLIILPGPDTAIITKNTVTKSRIAGFQTTFGMLTALLIHTLAAVFGLSTLIVKSALLFSVLKYVGAFYLIYLGCKSMLVIAKNRHPTDPLTASKNFAEKPYFKQGFLSNLLNPKVAVFFLTFLPQFAGNGNDAFVDFLLLGLTYTILTLIWFCLYIYLINYISEFMKQPATVKAVEGITGGILILFGIRLAFEKA